ncbi:MAG TPA: kelch repeat-containing protein [Chloroflexota bacterium]|nr:kelch repeat-containing protein [Chloroflexota bacterium]
MDQLLGRALVLLRLHGTRLIGAFGIAVLLALSGNPGTTAHAAAASHPIFAPGLGDKPQPHRSGRDQWTEISTTPAPAAQTGGVLAANPDGQSLVLFGGANSVGTDLRDTWLWNGQHWSEARTTSTPPTSLGARLVSDPTMRGDLYFGAVGCGKQCFQSETWTWNGQNWLHQQPATSPLARSDAAMAYDPRSHQVVLFGGDNSFNSPVTLNDTWLWNGRTWTRQRPAISPPARSFAALADDESSHSLILFGGLDANGVPLADTWAWNGKTWTQREPRTSPPARFNASLATVPNGRGVILFGGSDANDVALNDTWRWDGRTWTRLNQIGAPPSRAGAAFAYDPVNREFLLFGGSGVAGVLGDTWLLPEGAIR